MKSGESVLEQYMSGERFRREMDIARLWKHWPELVGHELAKMAKPLGRHGSSLVIGVEDNLLMQELVYESETILEGISRFLGWQPFDKIKFELLQDKTPLDELTLGRSGIATRLGKLPPPESVGALLDVLPEDSPFARCYRAYLALYSDRSW